VCKGVRPTAFTALTSEPYIPVEKEARDEKEVCGALNFVFFERRELLSNYQQPLPIKVSIF